LRGHDDPIIKVFLSPSTLTPFLEWNSKCKGEDPEAKTSCKGSHAHKEDDVEGKLINHFGSIFVSKSNYVELLK
jgi:hypothetical protein